MGTMAPVLVCSGMSVSLSLTPHPNPAALTAELNGHRAYLREELRSLVEDQGTPTTDPRVLALTMHLSRRQAAFEMEEDLRRQRHLRDQQEFRQQPELRRQPPVFDLQQVQREKRWREQLLDHYFRGVDLQYGVSPNPR